MGFFKGKKRRNSGIVIGFIIATLVMIVSACSPQGESGKVSNGKVYKWRMVTHQIPGTSRYDGTILPFVEAVKEASGGRLIIEPYGADNLFPSTDTFDSVKDGVVEMAAIYTGFWTGKDPIFALGGGTMPGDPIQGFAEHYYRSDKLEPLISKVYEKHGIKNLGSFDYAPEEILLSATPIRSIDDFKGKNIRAAGIASIYYGKLGASAISLSPPEIYTGLQLGTVDAAEYNDFLVNKELGLHEVTKYVIEPALHVGPSSDKELIVNPKAWESLPDDLKAIVMTARDEARYNSAVAYGVENQKAKQEWLDSGVEIIQLPDADVEEMRKVAFDLLLEYKNEGAASEEYINAYAEVLYDLGYVEDAKKLGYTR
ncbi:TRAP transporter substrate-binding protein DctP [Sporosarcina limicola]|uniref:TRAP-type mannitol/chloroaromatic compound transport system substrate-binding protein n=1 Tax=Sporosarcina limicola TaxID=34101 RepID=A0A927MSN4_9BACL|nr:TRAP transporter substrate-binding protein DctP [Sporosarcina limicola]MBE1556704.1 TRAP-type mannitol/chloroaromatic compound transport system substrate-binding protein [Sporosarcina limicola]